MKFSAGPQQSGPSSSLGIMRFFDQDTGGPKMTPEFVIGLSITLVIIVLALQIFT